MIDDQRLHLMLCSKLLIIVCYIAEKRVNMPPTPRLSHSAALILKAISLGYCFGLDVMEITGLPSGTVYPALRRLERDGLVESQWEPDAEAARSQRPARRYYEITKTGKAAALAATQRYPLLARLVPSRVIQEKRS